MRVFIGGVMQGSNDGLEMLDQSYRKKIEEALLRKWPDLEVVDPFSLHPLSLTYDDASAKQTMFEMLRLAETCDLLIAYLPTASMGTAVEIYAAYCNGVPVVAISDLRYNWVVRGLADKLYRDLETFLSAIRSADSLADLSQKRLSQERFSNG